MGVHGLWKLLEASGKSVPLESLEGKVLAIDISIWIYQVLQGYQDRHGVSRPNAHLLGLFTRICKLLYYKIKPVFVFDGGVPILKKSTIASRRKQKSIAMSKAQKMKADLINNLIKHRVVKTVLNKDSKDQTSKAIQITINTQTNEDMFVLPDMPSVSNLQSYVDDDQDDSDSSVELSPRKQSKWMGNIHNVDVTSNEFKALPADVRYDILTDLKETRKQNSWGRLYEMPQESQEFSGFQLKRLLKRRHVQTSLESAEKEMGGKTLTLEELDKLLTEQGVDTKSRDAAFRVAMDNTTRLIYISDKNALAKKSITNETEPNKSDMLQNVNEEIEPVAGPSNPMPIVENINEYELNDSDSENNVSIYNDALPIAENINEYTFDSEWESENDINESLTLLEKNMINPALTYMLEYSDLSQNQIMQLIKRNKDESRKTVSKNIKDTTKKDIYIELAKPDDKSVLTFPENCEQVLKSIESQSMKDACISKENTADELISSSPESDNLTQVKPLENNIKTSNITITSDVSSLDKEIISDKHYLAPKSNNVIRIDTSESDSDDFIEIQDVPIHDMNISRKMKKKDIEITFKIDKELEDDIFTDIFREVNKEKVIPVSPEQEQFVDMVNGEQQTQLISENSSEREDTLILDTIYEESIREKTKTKLPENIELSKNILDGEDIICDSENSSKSIEHSTNTSTRVNSLDECIQKKPQVLPTNKEDLIELKEQLDLLRLFGIPYIIAPMEAEAQCAYLEQIKLTDGTITDDSDIWLFGGQCVYKNFFNHNKRMLRFRACDIQHHFKLNRNQLIQLALLVGSDYTTGVAGVGPVTALEILAAFPADGDNVLHGLHNFCSWIKKGMFVAPGKTGLRNKLRNLKLNKDFPNQAIVQAYLFPTVDESKETFTWDKPNVVLLCDYTRQKFGWTKDKFDNTMIPVLRRMKENKNQKLLDMYLIAKASPHSIESSLSKRVQKALHRLNSDDVETDSNINGKPRLKKSKKDDVVQKSNKEKNSEFEFTELETPTDKIKNAIHEKERPIKAINKEKYNKEYIPQREKDKKSALEKKLHAIEIFRKSKQGLSKTRKVKYKIRKVKEQAELSESDSN
ncbi:ERCC5 protein, partial [Acromyrmex insinuator]